MVGVGLDTTLPVAVLTAGEPKDEAEGETGADEDTECVWLDSLPLLNESGAERK